MIMEKGIFGDDNSNSLEIEKIRKTSLRQSIIALIASVFSAICAVVILGFKISSIGTNSASQASSSSAFGIIVFPIIIFNVFLVAGLADSMSKNSEKVSVEFKEMIHKRKMISLILIALPFVVFFIPL